MKTKKTEGMMEWQGVINSECNQSLGTMESISTTLTSLFPGLVFQWSAAGANQLDAIQNRGVKLPDLVRRVVAAVPSCFCGSIKIGQMEASFNLGTGDPVTRIWATVGGQPKLVEWAIAQLKSQKGWILTSEPLTVQKVTQDQ
jgi:hypothetical protein